MEQTMTERPEGASKELTSLAEKIASKRKLGPQVKFERQTKGSYTVQIGADGSAEDTGRLMEVLGFFDPTMLGGFISQVSNGVSSNKGEVDVPTVDFAVGFVKSIEPRNEVEAALAAQMAATHVCLMNSSRRYLNAETITAKDSAERAINRFGRTFVAQMEGLKRFHPTTQQTVREERVTVNEGGQAIVGNVDRGGGHDKEKRR